MQIGCLSWGWKTFQYNRFEPLNPPSSMARTIPQIPALFEFQSEPIQKKPFSPSSGTTYKAPKVRLKALINLSFLLLWTFANKWHGNSAGAKSIIAVYAPENIAMAVKLKLTVRKSKESRIAAVTPKFSRSSHTIKTGDFISKLTSSQLVTNNYVCPFILQGAH